MINNHWGNRKEINIVFFIVLTIVIIYGVIKMKTKGVCKITALVIVLLMPVCFMNIFILAPKVEITEATGILMVPGMNYIYILLLLLGECVEGPKQLKKVSVCVFATVTVLILNMLCVLNLSAQTYIQYNMRKTYYVAGEMASKIEQLGVNTDEYKLCVLGAMENGNYPNKQLELESSVHWLSASYGMIWSDDNGRNSCWRLYLEQFIGNSYVSCNREESQTLKEKQEVMEMSIFPEENSVKVIDDVIVVKLSE